MKQFTHLFTETIPESIEDNVLYISLTYATVVHRCACGCGSEVVTPLAPREWHLTFDGESISLSPSIGNGKFACRSHYWVRNSEAQWIPECHPTSDRGRNPKKENESILEAHNEASTRPKKGGSGLWRRLCDWIKVIWR